MCLLVILNVEIQGYLFHMILQISISEELFSLYKKEIASGSVLSIARQNKFRMQHIYELMQKICSFGFLHGSFCIIDLLHNRKFLGSLCYDFLFCCLMPRCNTSQNQSQCKSRIICMWLLVIFTVETRGSLIRGLFSRYKNGFASGSVSSIAALQD